MSVGINLSLTTYSSQAIVFIPITLLLLLPSTFSVIPIIVKVVSEANFLPVRGAFTAVGGCHIREWSDFLGAQGQSWWAMLLATECRTSPWLFIWLSEEVESFIIIHIFQVFNLI